MHSFAELLAPMDVQEFEQKHWQSSPLLIRSTEVQNRYRSLFDLGCIDDVIRNASANAGDIDFFAAAQPIAQSEFSGPGNYLRLNRVLGHYATGGTIHISNLQKYASSLDSFCKSLQQHFYADVEADLWTTRQNSLPAYLHFDRHDIFVLQIHGTKRWRVFSPMRLAEGRPASTLEWSEVGEPLLDIELKPGDLLYLPEFTPHAVTTTLAPHSVHVGIGVHPFSWRHILECVVEILRTQPSPLQAAVPSSLLGSQNDPSALKTAFESALTTSIGQVDFSSVYAAVFDRFTKNVTAPDDKHFSRQVLRSIDLSPDTLIVRRNKVIGRAYIDIEKRACVTYSGGGAIVGSIEMLLDLQYVLSSNLSFCAKDLPGPLDMSSRLALLKRLIDAGLCATVEAPAVACGGTSELAPPLNKLQAN